MHRPNVVMIVTDNQSADSLGCYGNQEHETPRLDRLAREGALFLRAFATNGMCSPSRASILTGLMPSQHGVHLAIPDDDVLPKADDYDVTREFPTLPWSLKHAGYTTAMIGKWHLGNHRCRGNGFDHWVALTKGHTTDFYDNEVFLAGESIRVQGEHIVDYFADRAIDHLRELDDSQPFFVQVNFDGPYVLPPTVVGLDERNPFTERFRGRSFRPFPPVDPRLVASAVVPFDFDLDPAEEYTLESAFNNLWWSIRVHNDQATRANVAAQNALVDAAVGRIVDAVDDTGLGEDTLVVVTTDQGNPYGQHGLWGHPVWTDPPFMHDVTFRVPLIVRQPGSVPAMRVHDEIVSQIDFLPTLLDWCGVDPVLPAMCAGRSFASALRGEPLVGWRNEAYFENETARALRTPQHLYVAHLADTGEPELYDLVDDPGQYRNIASEPGSRDLVHALDRQLNDFFGVHADPRYDLWNGGAAQAMVSRYLLFKERYGPSWDVTCELGPTFAG